MKPLVWTALLGLGLPLAASADNTEKISNAMSAAPASVSAEATVLDWPSKAGEKPKVLRQGKNGWTCLPDYPATPGNDPMCLDRQWMKWLDAYLNKKKPHITDVGIAYMLQGGSDPSNTDPFAEKPAAGQDWMKAPPHVMILSPKKLDPKQLSSDPHSGAHWIMFGGTPYEHLMVPVQ